MEDGAYNRLLRLCWRSPGCKLPNDDAWIMRKMRAKSDDECGAVRAVLAEFFTTGRGKIWSKRLLEVHLQKSVAHSNKVEAGKKGAAAKALKINKTEPSTAKADLKQPEPEPEPERKKIGGGSASAREPTFREQILEVAGADPTTGLTGRGGQMIGRSDETAEIHSAMSNLVITEAEALAVITDAMARKQASRDPGPPSSLRFFVPALERYAAARDAPPRKPTRPRKPEVPLPPDWVPSDKNIAAAQQRNLSPSEIDHEASQFRNFHLSKDNRYRDWDAAWLSWLGNADRRKGPTARNTGPGAAHSALIAGFQWAAGNEPSGG